MTHQLVSLQTSTHFPIQKQVIKNMGGLCVVMHLGHLYIDK